MKLSQYFNKILSTSKIISGEKDNLKSLELVEKLNEIFLLDELAKKIPNYENPKEMCWYHFTKLENEKLQNTNPLVYKLGEKFYLTQNISKTENGLEYLVKFSLTNKKGE